MDEREGKDGEGEWWGIGIKMVIFGIIIFCFVVYIYVYAEKKRREFFKKINKNYPKGNVS
jgi:uncharacterized membrane protein